MIKMIFLLTILLFYTLAFGKVLTFEEAVQISLENNHDLKSLRDQANSLKYKSAQSLAPNSPTISYQKSDISGFDPSAQSASETITLGYTLNFPGKSISQSHMYKHQAESLREDAFGHEVTLMSLLYINMSSQYANEELVKTLTDEIKKTKDIILIQERKFSTGQVGQVDILNSRVTLAKLEQELLSLRNEQILLNNEFYNILGRPNDTFTAKLESFSVVTKIDLDVNQLIEIMKKNRSTLKSQDHQVESLKNSLTYSSLQGLPDFQFTTGVTQWNRPEAAPISGLTRDYNFGITITIPLFLPMNEWQGIKSAQADLENAENKRKALLAQSISDLSNAYVAYKASIDELERLTKVILPAARASYQLTLSSYSNGKTDFLRLNEARSTFLQTEKDIIVKRKKINQSYVELLQAVGCEFIKKDGPHACL